LTKSLSSANILSPRRREHHEEEAMGDAFKDRRRIGSRLLRIPVWARVVVLFVVAWPILFLLIRATGLNPSVGPAIVGASFAAGVLIIPAAVIWAAILESVEREELTPEARAWIEREDERAKAEWRAKRRKQWADAAKGLGALALLVGTVGVLLVGAFKACEWGEDRYEAWDRGKEMEGCKANLQADLVELLGTARDPTTTKCVGEPTKANCFYQALDDGVYKIHAVVGDCSRRYIETGIREKALKSDADRGRFRVQGDAFLAAIKDAK
jgi:hypothetical protein